jgi:hypothetical protein
MHDGVFSTAAAEIKILGKRRITYILHRYTAGTRILFVSTCILGVVLERNGNNSRTVTVLV